MSLKCILQGQDSKNLVTKVELNEHIADKNNPHEVTAEQVGAMHDYGLITAENLQTWASEQQLSGTFMIEPNTTKGVPYIGWWLGIVTIINKEPNNGYGLYIFNHNDTYCCMTDAGKWTAPWLKLTSNKYLSNPNLLDNWYFGSPINQRNGYIVPAGVDYYTFTWEKVGQTDKNYQVLLRRDAKNNYDCEIEINGTRYVVGGANSVPGYCGDRYTVDRWHLTTDGVLTVADEGIRLTSGALFEPFGYELSSLLKGKTVTYSFFFADNTLVTKSAVIPSTWGNWDSLIEIGDIQLIGLESGKRIWARYSSTTTAVAAKLELGDTQTLAHKEGDKWVLNEIPDFGEQLRRCTYYAEKVESDDTPAITNSAFVPSGATSAVFILPYARKRTVPVVHFNDVSNYRVIARSISGETTAFSVTSISLLDIGRTKAAILVSFNATDKGYYCFLQRQDNATDGYAFISADI